MTNSSIPNFFCIGAQKAGTSWLHHNLRQHPDIWMPPLKELHYFDINEKFPLITQLGKASQSGRTAKRAVKLLRRHPHWTLDYLLGIRNDTWYKRLFKPSNGQICGEVTPNYAVLEPMKITHIKSLAPDAQIIYLLRDPVNQIWSQTKMWNQKYGDVHIDAMSESEIQHILEQKWTGFYQHVNYLENLAKWQEHYTPNRFVIGFFDQMAAEPAIFLKRVLRFMNVSTDDRLIPPDIAKARNERPSKPMPTNIRRWLTEKFYPQIEAIDQHFDDTYTEHWLRQAQLLLT